MNYPKKRSKIRLYLGNYLHGFRKRLIWVLSGAKIARQESLYKSSCVVFEHRTPLRRPLKGDSLYLQENKINNLTLAVRRINNCLIKPGEIFSYWRLIGNPTKRKGYKEGMVLQQGKIGKGTGGGLCQLSNLIYWITLHTPLTITERWRHGYDVFPDVNRSQPFGSGATCYYPQLDLCIENNTKQNFQLILEITDTELIGKWMSDQDVPYRYTIQEREPKITHESWGGYVRQNKLVRVIVDKMTGDIVTEETVAENKAIMMYEPFLEPSV